MTKNLSLILSICIIVLVVFVAEDDGPLEQLSGTRTEGEQTVFASASDDDDDNLAAVRTDGDDRDEYTRTPTPTAAGSFGPDIEPYDPAGDAGQPSNGDRDPVANASPGRHSELLDGVVDEAFDPRTG